MATVDEHQSDRRDERMVEVQEGDYHWQLLPGIPDEITKDKIGPKLPWTTFRILSRVNRDWQQAIQGHEFYDARVRSHSTETLVALYLGHEQSNFNVIALYSVNDNSSYLLPPIPGTGPKFGFQLSYGQCISLDGKVYFLGGFKHSPGSSSSTLENHGLTRSEVYVMDLAGEGQWKQCASMQDPRYGFGCGVLNGKIYVFGGTTSNGWPVCGSEVYDPTEDAWSPIAPMVSFRSTPKVTAVGEELFVYSGACSYFHDIHGSDNLVWERSEAVDLRFSLAGGDLIQCLHVHPALFAEVYRPLKNEWRIVKDFTVANQIHGTEIMMVGEKLHRINRLGIDLYNSHSNSWIPSRQSLSVDIPAPNDLIEVGVNFWDHSILVEDKIITLADLDVYVGETGDIIENYRTLMRSDRLGGKNKDIVMRELHTKSSLPPGYVLWTLFPSSIQL